MTQFGSAARRLTALLFLASSIAAPLTADRIVTRDNRVLECKKARATPDGYVFEFEHGSIEIKDKSLVKAVEVEGDMSDYVPANDDERKKLEAGYVRFRGQWWSKLQYEDMLRKEAEANRKRTEELAAHAEFSNAWSRQTKHFTINTNTSPELLDYYCDLLETYYSAMDDRFNIKPSPTLARTSMVVNIYKNRAEFHKLNAAGLGGGVAGYFSPSTKDLNFYHDYDEPSISEWVALHECTHLLTFLIDPQYVSQIWLNEAVADYFGSAEISRDKKGKLVIQPGKVQTDRVLTVQQAIKEGNDIKLERLFQIEKADFQAFEYSHAWSFIYFLNEASGKKYQKGFNKFFKDIYTLAKGIKFEVVPYFDKSGTGKKVPADEIRRVVLASLGVKDVEQLEREWKEFIAAVPVEGPDARFKRGYRAVAQGGMFAESAEQTRKNMDQALEDLTMAIDGGIKDPRAWWARSRLLENMNKDAEALKDIEVALAMDPLNAAYHWNYADLLYPGFLGVSFGGFDIQITSDRPAEPPSAEVRRHMGLATALAPQNEMYAKEFQRVCGP